MEKKGIVKALLFVESLDKLVGLGEAVMKDGKVNMNDLVHLPALAPILNDLMSVYSDREEFIAEMKDIDWEEFKQLVEKAID